MNRLFDLFAWRKAALYSGIATFAICLSITAGCGGSSSSGGGGNSGTPVSLNLANLGGRGTIPIAVKLGNSGATVTSVYDANGTTVSTNSLTPITLTAPPAYADRVFNGWIQSGGAFSTDTTVTFTPASLTGTGTISAYYLPLPVPSGGFTPNYNTRDFPHWTTFPVKVYIDPSITPGSNNYLLINVGMTRWLTASGGLLNYTIVTDPSQANITVSFGSTPEGSAGETDTTWDGTNAMTSAVIKLNPPSTSATTTTPQNLQTIMAHEFGHSLGLTGPEFSDGHSPDSNDTMFATGNSQIGVVTERDINTMANVYPNLFDGSSNRSVRKTSTTPAGVKGSDGLYHGVSY